jgi:hypothetical protein
LLPNNEINNIAYFDPLSFNNKVIMGKGFFMMKWNVKKKLIFGEDAINDSTITIHYLDMMYYV